MLSKKKALLQTRPVCSDWTNAFGPTPPRRSYLRVTCTALFGDACFGQGHPVSAQVLQAAVLKLTLNNLLHGYPAIIYPGTAGTR